MHNLDLELLYESSGLSYSFETLFKTRNLPYIPSANTLSGIKVDSRGNIFLTVPRWIPGVPSTLNFLNVSTGLLESWPSPEIQDNFNDPNDLMNVQSMFIDSRDQMWVIDVGRRNQFTNSPVDGAPKLLIIDIPTRKIIDKYVFSDSVASYNRSVMQDLVVDEAKQIAYFADSSGSIVVFDRKLRKARRYTDKISTQNEPDYQFVINGIDYGNQMIRTRLDGIAIDSSNENIYYCPLQGVNLYSIATKYLNNFDLSDAEIERNIVSYGKKASPSDGIYMYGQKLYFGGVTTNALYSWDSSLPLNAENQIIEAQNPETLNWVNSFSIQAFRNGNSKDTYLYFLSNRLNLFLFPQKRMDFSGESGANFRVFRMKIDSQFISSSSPVDGFTITLIVIGSVTLFGIFASIILRDRLYKFWCFSKKFRREGDLYENADNYDKK
jgi:hypothetical protein